MVRILSLLLLPALLAAEPFPFSDGDRIALVGGTLIERERQSCHWETMLTAAYPEKNLRFRNLGWSGDTVWGESRAGFKTSKEGYENLVSITLEWKPTVIWLGYGFNESFEGPSGLEKFTKQYNQLLDALAPAKARLILMGLPRVATPNADAVNANVKLYDDAVRKIAAERKAFFLDPSPFFGKFAEAKAGNAWTENGMHLNDAGYRDLAETLREAFGAPGSKGDTTALRKAITEKNELHFHRWRPQNETYLFGFRKHEQGKNAKEVFEFDPLVEAAEKKIVELKKKN